MRYISVACLQGCTTEWIYKPYFADFLAREFNGSVWLILILFIIHLQKKKNSQGFNKTYLWGMQQKDLKKNLFDWSLARVNYKVIIISLSLCGIYQDRRVNDIGSVSEITPNWHLNAIHTDRYLMGG